MLGHEPMPGGLLSHIIGHAKALPVYLVEEGWCQVLHFCRLCMTDLLSSSFYALPWVFPGIPSSYWPNDDVIPLPPEAPPPLGESSISDILTQMPFCICSIHLGQGYSGLHSLFSFWRVNNSSSPNTCTPNTLYTTVHTSKVSVREGCPTSIPIHIQPLCHLTHGSIVLT